MRIVSATLFALSATLGAAQASDLHSKIGPYDGAADARAETDIVTIDALAPDMWRTDDGDEIDYSSVEAQGDAAYEDEVTGGWTFAATSGMVSDYRYRGVSLTNRDPAFQADMTFASPDGFYVYGWASQVADNGGENVELMGQAGWSGAFFTDAITLDASAGLYAYPGLSDASIWEFSMSFTQMIGEVSVTSGLSYMPEQESLADLDDTYMSLTVGSPVGFWDASASLGLGWEQGAFGDDKVDWIAAVDVPIEDFSLRVAFAGAERHFYGSAGDNAIFAELRYNLGG